MDKGVTRQEVEDLSFVLWQLNANDKAYAAKLITRPVYEFAKNELQKNVERLSKICYNVQRG